MEGKKKYKSSRKNKSIFSFIVKTENMFAEEII